LKRLINLGKYGSFHTNHILGRPYHLTFEILDRSEAKGDRELRVVSAAEIHATALLEEADDGSVDTPAESEDIAGTIAKTNVNINDDPTNQKLTMTEIEALKQDDMGSTKDLITKIMESHSTLDQKTAFSLAKYTLRKHKKYMKQFTVLPLDVSTLADWFMIQRDFSKVMELRNETMGLMGCWANIHHSGDHLPDQPSGGYLIVDDTSGLVLAAMAERMGILHQEDLEGKAPTSETEDPDPETVTPPSKPNRQPYAVTDHTSPSNTLTVVHSNQQPNLSLLRYFNFDHNNPTPSHPLYTHLRTLSWLQLLDPASDETYQEPEFILPEVLATLKSNRRSNYFRKRRRWQKTRSMVDETRQGGFNGLVVASYTNPTPILRHLVPLLAGGSQVIVYSAHIEPLVELADYYSTARRTAFLNAPQSEVRNEEGKFKPSEDFPVDPTLLLVPAVHTSRVRKWQVLPGRTHPLMTGRGGSEGYVFVATRVVPLEGKVEARGNASRGKGKKERAESVKSGADTKELDEEGAAKRGYSESRKKKKLQEELDNAVATAEGEAEGAWQGNGKAQDMEIGEDALAALEKSLEEDG
jgi:tRNA (adenine58-N1)-methyltransferase non-catalytic subunit